MMTKMTSIRLALFLFACAHTQSPSVVADEAANSGPDSLVETVVYTTLRPPNWDIFLFDEPEGPPRRLTDHPALDYNAVFSPDGRWLVLTSERVGGADLYALDLEADAAPVRLTHHPAMDDAATFSPDGERLAFVSTRDGHADIFVMPFVPEDSTMDERAVNLTRRSGGDFNPAFSPDGRSIAFARQEEQWPSADREPTDLSHMAFQVYVMEADGSNPRRVSEPGPGLELGELRIGAGAGSPAWSADGEAIYYYRIGREGAEIRRVGPDGSGDAPVATGGLSPAVLPDGRVAFSQPQPRPGMDAYDILRLESDTLRSYFAPAFDRSSGRMVAHGTGPVEGLELIRDGYAFAPAGAQRRAELPDRTLEVRGIRGYFPALTRSGEVLSTPLHTPAPAVPLQASAIDGGTMRDVFTPESGIAWGSAVARERGWIVVAVGSPFAGGDASADIWKLRLDGSGAVNLTADVEANDALPHVSADGRRIAFRRRGEGRSVTVHVMDGDGTNRRRLTDADAVETMPALSPDGEWVVFPTDRTGERRIRKIWLQRVDGSEGRFLEPDRLDIPDVSMHPRFSPDGEWVVFTSNRGGFNDEYPLTWFPQPYGDLWAVPVAGGPAVRLTDNKWEDGPNDWGYVRLPDQP